MFGRLEVSFGVDYCSRSSENQTEAYHKAVKYLQSFIDDIGYISGYSLQSPVIGFPHKNHLLKEIL
jgi:hypothetical protein